MTARPVLASTREELAAALSTTRSVGGPVALVPTMGALHDGHAALMRLARQRAEAGSLVASVFVNPLQFGPGEDLDRYPRTLGRDLEVCAAERVDVVFAPGGEEMYPGSGTTSPVVAPQVTVDPGPLGERLEGASRPGHFAGVLTVVAKLFGLVRPDIAVFGEKDYQQLTLVRRMVSDLCLGVEVVGAPTHRESDGLAMSSRNRFLDAGQRRTAAALSRALAAARDAAVGGPDPAEEAARSVLAAEPGLDLDYLVVTGSDLEPVPVDAPPGMPGRVLVAARVGSTRLIDNMALELGTGRSAAVGQDLKATAAGTDGRSG